MQPTVHHKHDILDGDRSLCDIRRQNDLPLSSGRSLEDQLLFLVRETRMGATDHQLVSNWVLKESVLDGDNVVPARQETQNGPLALGGVYAIDDRGDKIGVKCRVSPSEMGDFWYGFSQIFEEIFFYWIDLPWDVNDGTFEVLREGECVEGGTHQQEFYVLVVLDESLEQDEEEVDLDVPLVDFVNDDVADAVQVGVAAELSQEHSRGAEEDGAFVLRQVLVQANVVADCIANL